MAAQSFCDKATHLSQIILPCRCLRQHLWSQNFLDQPPSFHEVTQKSWVWYMCHNEMMKAKCGNNSATDRAARSTIHASCPGKIKSSRSVRVCTWREWTRRKLSKTLQKVRRFDPNFDQTYSNFIKALYLCPKALGWRSRWFSRNFQHEKNVWSTVTIAYRVIG